MRYCNDVSWDEIASIWRLISTSYFSNFGIPISPFAQYDLYLFGSTRRRWRSNGFPSVHITAFGFFYAYGVSLVWEIDYCRWALGHFPPFRSPASRSPCVPIVPFSDFGAHCDALMRSCLANPQSVRLELGRAWSDFPESVLAENGHTS